MGASLRAVIHCWRRRVGIFIAIVLVATWIAWLAFAHRRLKSAVAAAETAGETLDPSHLVWHPSPTTLPAGRYLHQALAALSTTQPSTSLTEGISNETPPFSEKWYAVADLAIRANSNSFALVRRSRGFREDAWGFNDFQFVRQLSMLLYDAAIHAHHVGDDDEALELVLDACHLAWCMNRDVSTTSPFVAFAVEAEANTALNLILAQPRNDPYRNPLTLNLAQRAKLEALITTLLDDGPLRERLRYNARDQLAYEFQ